MTIWDQMIPELEKAGPWRTLCIQQSCAQAYIECAQEQPVLADLLELLVLNHDGIGVQTGMALIAAVGAVMNKLEWDGG
jgi:hypothetical protein